MPFLISAVVLAFGLSAVNLLLNVAVIRRLREHTDLLAGGSTGSDPGIIGPGQTPGEFAATDANGRPLRRDELTGDVLVAFFSTSCRACTDALPRFVASAATFPSGRDRVLAVVSGDSAEASPLAEQLAEVARVVIEDHEGALATAFRVGAFPSWCVLDATGTVSRSASGSMDLPMPVAA